MLSATSEVALTLSNFAISAAENSMALSTTAWRGIDVLQVKGMRCDGSFAVDSPEVALTWLLSPPARRISPCLEWQLIDFVVAGAKSVSRGLPVLDTSAQDLNVDGLYGHFHVRASLAATGHILVHYSAVNISFVARWSNPVWETLNFSVTQEKDQVLSQLEGIQAMLPVHLVNWNAEEEVAYHAPSSMRWFAACQRWWRSWCMLSMQTFQLLGLASWHGWGAIFIVVQSFLVLYYAFELHGMGQVIPIIPG